MTKLLVAAVAALLVWPAAASAEITVNATADPGNGDCDAAECTLREAVNEAPAGETIVLPAGVYSLVDDFTLPRDVTIRGAGARTTTIRRHIEFPGRVLFVDSLAAVTLTGVRVTGGRAPADPGAGILVEANGELHLFDSAIEDNVADRGGGIFSSGTLEIVRSTIARNDAVGQESTALGGGLHIAAGAASLENTTVSGNSAIDETQAGAGRGGGIWTAASLDLRNVTIADNSSAGTFGTGGGLYQSFGSGDNRSLATNTLVARNTGGNCGGTVVNDDNSIAHPIQSTNGVSDEVAQPSCNVVGPNNQLVADTRLGALANNGGQTDTHALLTGSPGIDKGALVGCPLTDQRSVSRPRGAGCDVGAYEFVPPPASGPPPPPPGDEELPPPVAGKSVNALPQSGTVKIKLPGSDVFVVLSEGQQIPVGTIVDARKGHVTLISAGGGDAEFYGGVFKIGQTTGAKPLTTLSLVEKLTCAKSKAANAAARKKRKRRLWGDGTGRFRTKGKHSAATVVGTKWLVEDKCRSTLTRVVRGRVRVRDFVKKKTVIVKAGKKYVARARR